MAKESQFTDEFKREAVRKAEAIQGAANPISQMSRPHSG